MFDNAAVDLFTKIHKLIYELKIRLEYISCKPVTKIPDLNLTHNA